MSQKVTYKIKDRKVQPPIDSRNVVIELRPNEVDSTGEPIISAATFNFAHEEATIINDYVEDGATGKDVGLYEGIPLNISVQDDNGSLEIFDGYLLTDGAEVVYSKESVENIKAELRGKIASLSKRSKTVVYSELVTKGVIIPTRDYVSIPYIINSIPNYKSAAIITLTLFVVANQARDIVKEIGKVTADIASVLSAIAGVLKVVILIAWIIIIIIQIIILINNIFDQLIQRVKYHSAMLWKKLLEIGCNELGYSFESTIFESDDFKDTVILPAKFEAFDDPTNKLFLGFTKPEPTKTSGEYAGSFYDLLKDTKATFRAKITIIDNRLIIEPVSAPTQSPKYKLPPLRRRRSKTNAYELISNYQLSFRQDETDANTKTDYTGVKVAALTVPMRVNDPKSVSLDTFGGAANEVFIPFARGSRKFELTRIEKNFSTLLKAVVPAINVVIKVSNKVIEVRNKVVKKINKIVKKLKKIGIRIPFKAKEVPLLTYIDPDIIDNRIGMLMIEDDTFSEPKVISLDISTSPVNTKVKLLNSSIWNATSIYNSFHKGQSHEISAEFPTGNQERIYSNERFPLCKESAEEVISNSRIFTDDGLTARVISLKWNPTTGIAESIEYRLPQINTTNLKTILIEPPNGL